MFRVGQKVVCVDARPTAIGRVVTGVEAGKVYTISWTGSFDHPGYGRYNNCVRLYEVKRRKCPIYGIVTPYNATRFRPIVERKTDISIFEAMLDRTSAPSKVEA